MEKRKVIRCFEAIIDEQCERLILGSMPSRESRLCNFYYSNPTNRFWKALSFVFNEDFVNANSREKKELLLKNKVALFDVYASCEMKKEGSSFDGDIRNQKFNDIPSLIKNTKISKIFITSKKAYIEFLKNFKKESCEANLKIIYLPSSSSANRSVYKTDEELVSKWKEVILNE